MKQISGKTGIQSLTLAEFFLALYHTDSRIYVSVGNWFERLTCQELEYPSCMLESCNDE